MILTDDNPDLRLGATQWALVDCRIKTPDEDDLSQPHIVKVVMGKDIFEGSVMQALLQSTPKDRWHLDRPFFDVNTGKAERFLRHLSAEQAA